MQKKSRDCSLLQNYSVWSFCQNKSWQEVSQDCGGVLSKGIDVEPFLQQTHGETVIFLYEECGIQDLATQQQGHESEQAKRECGM